MRTSHSRDAYAQLKETFGDKVFETVIRASIAYAESAEKALSILEYRPDLGADYLALADEVLARIGREDARGALAPMLLHSGLGHGYPRLPLRRLGGVHASRGVLAVPSTATRARRPGAQAPKRHWPRCPDANADVVLLDTLGRPGDDTLLLAIREVAT